MAFGAGKNGILKVDNGAGTLTDISAFCDKVDAPFSVNLLDTTTFGAAGETEIPGLKAGDKITASGKLDPTIHTHIGTLYNNGGQLTAGGSISIEYGPMGSTSGNPKWTAETYLSKWQESTDAKGLATFSLELTVTAGATSTTY